MTANASPVVVERTDAASPEIATSENAWPVPVNVALAEPLGSWMRSAAPLVANAGEMLPDASATLFAEPVVVVESAAVPATSKTPKAEPLGVNALLSLASA